MTVDTTHPAFLDSVPEWALELGPGACMTRNALSRPYLCQLALGLVDGMARDAGNLTPGMAAVNATCIGRLIHMTGEADSIGCGWL
jgi:hypothetical protein